MAAAIGYGVSATTPFTMAVYDQRVPGYLFLTSVGTDSVKRAMRYYRMAIFVIVPLVMAIITFEHYSDRNLQLVLAAYALSFYVSHLA